MLPIVILTSQRNHGFSRPGSGDRIGVTMHQLPHPLFLPEDARHSNRYRRDVIASANLGAVTLDLDEAGKFWHHVLRDALDAGGLAISVMRCGTLQRPQDIVVPASEWAKGVS